MQFRSFLGASVAFMLAGQSLGNPVPAAEIEERTLGLIACKLSKGWWWNNKCWSQKDKCENYDHGKWDNDNCYDPKEWCEKQKSWWDNKDNSCNSPDDYCKKYSKIYNSKKDKCDDGKDYCKDQKKAWDSKIWGCRDYDWNQWGQKECSGKNCCWSKDWDKCYAKNCYGGCWD